MSKRNISWLFILLMMVSFLLNIPHEAYAANSPPNIEWTKIYGGNEWNRAFYVEQVSDGGYIVAGDLGNYTWLIKTDANGNQQWAYTDSWVGSNGTISKAQQTSDGGYILVGSGYFFNSDVVLIKLDANGNLQWKYNYNLGGAEFAYAVQQTNDGGYIITGDLYDYILLFKVDASGNKQWYKTYWKSGYRGIGYDVKQVSDGGYIIAGCFQDSTTSITCAIKTDANGNQLWDKTFMNGAFKSVLQVPDLGYVLAGYAKNGFNYNDGYVVVTDENGNTPFPSDKPYGARYFGSSLNEAFDCVQRTTDGGYILAGYRVIDSAGRTQAYLVKLDANMNVQWKLTFGTTNNSFTATFIQQTSDYGYIVTGICYLNSYDFWLTKFGPDGTLVPSLASISVSPSNITLGAGKSQQLTVTATYSNNTTQDVTSSATYQSSNTSVATVSNTGLVTAVASGTANITVTYQGKTVTVPVTVVEPSITVKQTGDIIVLKVPQRLQPVTYNSAAGFTVTENGVDVPVTKVEVKDGTDGWPFSEVWLYLQHPVTVGSDVVVRYNPDSNYPLIPIDGGTVTVPTTVVINQSTVPLTLERSTITVQPDGKVVYITFPTKVKVVEYEGSAGYTVYSGGTSIQVTRVVTDGNGAYLYLEHPVPQREIVTVSYIPVQGQEITTVTGTPLSGTTNPVTVVNDSTSPVVIYEAPVVSEDGRTVTITAPSDLQDVIYEGNAGFRVFVGDQEIPVVKVEVKDDKIILYLGVPLIGGQVPEISYTPVEGQPIETSNGTPVSSIDNLQGINQSTLSLDRITVEPNSMSLLEGETQQLTVTAHYSDGSAVDVTTLASYQTDNSQVATVSDDGLVTGVKAGNATVTVTYEGKIATVPVTVAPVLSSITVSPNPISIAKGQSQGITVTATYSDGSTKDVTGEVNFQVEDATIASVINGVVKGLNRGNTQITVVYKDKSTTVPVTVTEAVVSKLEAAPNPISIPKGTSQQITVTVTYSDGSTKDVSGEASYLVGDGSIAIVNGGKVTGLEKGNTQVTITYQGQSLQVPVTVTEAVVTKLEATPNPVSIPKGNSQQITVTAIYSDGSTKDVTTEVNYQAGDASIADVIGGKVTGLKEGSTQVTVSYQGQTIQVPVTVTEAIMTKLEATPNPISVAKGLSQPLAVTAIYSDGSTKDVTNEASYQIADSSIANINGNSVKGLAEGNTNLTITYQGQTVTVSVTVTQPVITGLQVVPNPVSIAKGQSQQLQVTANYSDGSSRDVTGEASYRVADSTIAAVNSGKVTGLAKGSTQVTVSYQGQEVQVPIAVTDPVVTGLKATPNPVSIAKGTSQQLTVTAIYSDGSTKEVTQEASYQIENASVATVDKGLVRGITQGNTNVTISYQGQSIQVPVTVTAPILVGLTAEPSQINLEKGQSQKLTVKAEYSDGSVVDVSDVATYQVANGSIASITNGVLKGEAPGSTLVTASYQGKTVQVPVTVTAPVLTGITVTPQSISLEEGKSQKLTVTANYSDGSTKDVTAEVSYQSGNNAIAVVNNGVVTGVKQGNTQVTVSYQGKTVQVPVTVTPPPVTQIGISIIPNPIQVSKYGSVRLQVLTVMSDGSTKDVTMAAQFTSLNTSIATVKSNGVVYGKNNGQTSIIVTYNGKEYEIPVIVGQIPVITQDKSQSQTPIVVYPEKQDSGTPIIVYPQS